MLAKQIIHEIEQAKESFQCWSWNFGFSPSNTGCPECGHGMFFFNGEDDPRLASGYKPRCNCEAQAIVAAREWADDVRDSAACAASLADQAIEAVECGDWETALELIREAATIEWEYHGGHSYRRPLLLLERVVRARQADFVLHCRQCGYTHEIPRDVTADVHPHVLQQLECESGDELQYFLDQYQVEEFLDDYGVYVGPDDYGVGLAL